MDHHSPQKRRPPDGYSSDYGIDEENMFADDGFWEVLDRVEKEALEDGERSNSNTQSKSKVDYDGDGSSQRLSSALPTRVHWQVQTTLLNLTTTRMKMPIRKMLSCLCGMSVEDGRLVPGQVASQQVRTRDNYRVRGRKKLP
jgi:hypothetical protein